jgi:HAD superfamily hydrolase (TIGR01549 family)
LRRQRQWQQVYGLFYLTELPPGTHQFLQEARQLAYLGIITTSPRPYAEQLIAYHHCQVPVVVAYHDTPRQKPAPDSILIAAQKLQVPATNCFYIGDALNDIVAAMNASAIPIGLSWDDSLKCQDISSTCKLCKSWDEVLTVIKIMMAEKGAFDSLILVPSLVLECNRRPDQ